MDAGGRAGCRPDAQSHQVVDGAIPTPTKAPTLGQHTDEVLTKVLGYDGARITALRDAGALG